MFLVDAGSEAESIDDADERDVEGVARPYESGRLLTRGNVEDPGPHERLVRDQVVLDICPTSNVVVGLFPSLETHPVAAFWKAGVNFTISSDDPPFMRTTLTDELRHVVRLAGLSRDDLAELQRRAARAAFVSAATRAELLASIDAWVDAR